MTVNMPKVAIPRILKFSNNNLPNVWKECKKGGLFCNSARVSITIQYIAFLLSIIVASLFAMDSLKAFTDNKRRTSATLALNGLIILVLNYAMLYLMSINPTISVVVLVLQIYIYLSDQNVFRKVFRDLGLI